MIVTREPPILYFGTPVALLGSTNPDGSANLAPMSSVFWLGWRAILGLSAASQTAQNIQRTREVTINLPSAAMADAVDRLALTTGADPVPVYKAQRGYRFEAAKFARAGLTAGASETIGPMRVLEAPVQLEARIESFFSLLREERTSAAYQKLFEGSFVGEEDKELLQQLTDVTDDILEACGKLDSTELLSVNSAGRTVREIVYAVNFRKRPVRWRLYAYLSEGRWQIIDTSVNPDITAFFHDELDPPHQPVPDKSEK
jgi:flavin reductase (DIM6/NTAB) family NADH-FMN oxidoreductase RutF